MQTAGSGYPGLIPDLVAKAFPQACILECSKLTGGLANLNFKLRLDSPELTLVLRIYQRDPAACAREIGLLQLLRGAVPVPDVFYAEPLGTATDRPFALLSYIGGITFQQLKRSGDIAGIQKSAYDVGKNLATIGRYKFADVGTLGTGFAVTETFIKGPDPVPRFLDRCLSSDILQKRVTVQIQDRLHDLIWSWAPRFEGIEQEQSLVHCDFGSRNILVNARLEKANDWEVVGIIDWEFAFFGSPLFDIGHFLRYERDKQPLREPYFSRGFIDGGGTLPDDWRQLARMIDLTALVDLLTRPDLPTEIVAEILELLQATITSCDQK
ncbi:MAG TPA: phosphotransferase [Pyrinomonadaceae bacterium]|nr:phosphotransferase [Pyrinomonadaceae bacterium]